MRASAVFVAAAFGALAQAQSSAQSVATASVVSTAAVSTPTLDPAQQAIYDCLAKCDAGDVSCTSKCTNVPNPDTDQVNATNECVAACPKGNGTAADSATYSTCLLNCISDNYFTATGTPATATGSSANKGGSAVSGSAATATGSNSGSDASSTASGASVSGTGSASSAAPAGFQLSAASFGLLGFLAAALIL